MGAGRAFCAGYDLKQFAEGTLARYKADGMLPPIIEMLEKPSTRRAANNADGEPEYLI